MIGLGFELYKWATERGLEIPLLILSITVLIILIVITVNLKNEPRFTSLCRNCKYEKRNSGSDSLSCSLCTPKRLFMSRRRLQCPFEELINKVK